MIRTALLLPAALLLAGLAPAADPPDSAYEHLKAIEWHVGDWVAESTAPYDLGDVKKGDHIISNASRRWAFNKTAMILDGLQEVNGRRIPLTHEVYTWDPATKKITVAIASSFGPGRGVVLKAGPEMVLEFSATGPKGTLKGTGILKKVDNDSYTWELQDATLDGKELPPWPAVTYRRKTAVAAGELWDAFRKAMAGTWTGEGKMSVTIPELKLAKGDPVTGRTTLKESTGGKALAGEADFVMAGQPFSNRSLIGWDPDARQVRYLVFWSGGVVEDVLFTRRQGPSFLGTYIVRIPGQATTPTPVRFTFANPDTYSLVFTDGPQKGQVLFTWKRVQGAGLIEPLQPLAAMVGDWTMKGQWADGVPFEGEEHVRVGPGGHFLLGSGWYQERDGQRIDYEYQVGWDAGKKQTVMHFACSDGIRATRTGTLDAATRTWTNVCKFAQADGRPGSFDQVLRIENDNRLLWTGTNFKGSDKPLPDLKFTFTRK